MTIFQIICMVLFIITIVVLLIAYYLCKNDVDEGELIGYIAFSILVWIGGAFLIAGASGLIVIRGGL